MHSSHVSAVCICKADNAGKAIHLAKHVRLNPHMMLILLLLYRDLAAQQTDTEGRYFDERLRERELARKAAARSPLEIERTKEYERDY